MENDKKNLAKKAFAALVLAASLPVAGHAVSGVQTDGILLAGGSCGSSRAGCGAATNPDASSYGTYGSETNAGTYVSPNHSSDKYGTSSYNNYDTTGGTYSGSNGTYGGTSGSYGSTNSSYGGNSGNYGTSNYNRPNSTVYGNGSNYSNDVDAGVSGANRGTNNPSNNSWNR